MPRLRRKPMPTYLYNRFGIQAEVEVTKDKVGNFLKSLVDDSGKRKGDSGDLMLQCWPAPLGLDQLLLHAPQMLPAIKTLWWLLLAPQNLVQRLPSSTLQQTAFNCPYWLARKMWKSAVQTGLDRQWEQCSEERRSGELVPGNRYAYVCMWYPVPTAGPCLSCPQLPSFYMSSLLLCNVTMEDSCNNTWACPCCFAERLLYKFSTNHNHLWRFFFHWEIQTQTFGRKTHSSFPYREAESLNGHIGQRNINHFSAPEDG